MSRPGHGGEEDWESEIRHLCSVLERGDDKVLLPVGVGVGGKEDCEDEEGGDAGTPDDPVVGHSGEKAGSLK